MPVAPEGEARGMKPPQGVESSLVFHGWASLRHDPNNEYDPNAIEVVVMDRKVGYIARNKNHLVLPYLERGNPLLRCSVFWNGDPEADYQFYTVQLFS